jgi:hypothetical protein
MAWRSRRSRRCSVLCSGPAPLRSRTAHPPRPAPRVLVTPRRRRGSPAPTAPPPLLPPSPLTLPLRRRCSGKGQNPNVGWWRWSTATGSPPLAFEPTAPQGWAKSRGCPSWVRPGGRGGTACPFLCVPGTPRHGAGAKGSFLSTTGSIRARARPFPSACVPLGGPAVLRPASGCGETGGAGAAR